MPIILQPSRLGCARELAVARFEFAADLCAVAQWPQFIAHRFGKSPEPREILSYHIINTVC